MKAYIEKSNIHLSQGCPNFMGRGPHSARKLDRRSRLTFHFIFLVNFKVMTKKKKKSLLRFLREFEGDDWKKKKGLHVVFFINFKVMTKEKGPSGPCSCVVF